jgi:hypothetical protein
VQQQCLGADAADTRPDLATFDPNAGGDSDAEGNTDSEGHADSQSDPDTGVISDSNTDAAARKRRAGRLRRNLREHDVCLRARRCRFSGERCRNGRLS